LKYPDNKSLKEVKEEVYNFKFMFIK